jgi:hypothetical protein
MSSTLNSGGPAVANLLYFIHPAIIPPFNAAIVKGYNMLAGANVKLGRILGDARRYYPPEQLVSPVALE